MMCMNLNKKSFKGMESALLFSFSLFWINNIVTDKVDYIRLLSEASQ